MTFNDILAQVLDLLQRQGRVSYRALKLRFDIGDDYIEGLKDELIYALQVAVDEHDRVLVWIGEAHALSESIPTAMRSAKPDLTQESQSDQTDATPVDTRPPDAERRQLTVMFCDLVESMALSGQLDPEDYREVVRAYQRVCTGVIQHYDGHVAQLLGDGLLAYFGYPQAHEDDAQRAARTGLGIIEAIGPLNTRLEQTKGIRLAVRLGIHTGLVVVGEMGGAGRQEQLALGEVPNIASRIQGLTEPNTVLVSSSTYRLIQGYFECQELGVQTLRGVSQPIPVYQVLQESGAWSRLEVALIKGLTPLVGRESEVALLLDRWEQVKEGQGHIVLLSGEAGIGKSRLVQVLKDHIANESPTQLECRSSPYYQHTALHPIIDLLQHIIQWHLDDTPDEKLEKLEDALSQYRLPLEESVPLLAPLLSLSIPEDRYPSLALSPQRQRQKTLETILAIILALSERQPVLFILEDLHWTDPTTLEFLELMMEQTSTASICALLTCRPTFQPSWQPNSALTAVTVNRLSNPQVEQIIEQLTDGKRLPTEALQQIVEKTDGVPLFVEEMTKTLLESGHLKEVDGHYELSRPFSSLTIPVTLQDSLMARLDRLLTAKVIAQLGATIGRQFPFPLLQAVSALDAATLQRELGRLVEAELLYQHGLPPQATYLFKHALIQEAAYQSLLKSTRQQYHQQIAQVLEERFPETAETQPELLAHHYTVAGLGAQAIAYWQQAGRRALERSAHVEAISHLTKGLEVLKALPDMPESTQRELDLQTLLGSALMATKGYAAPEVEHTYARARELCQRVGETPRLFPILWGLWAFYLVRAELQTARVLGEQLLRLARSVQDRVLLLEAHYALGDTLFWLGELIGARTHFQQSIALYDPQQHSSLALLYGEDAKVTSLSYLSWILWRLGYPHQALQKSQEALILAQQLSHTYSLAFALFFSTWLQQLLGEAGPLLQQRAEAVITLAVEHGFVLFEAIGTILRGWALAEQGQGEEGIAQMRQGLAAYTAAGTRVAHPAFLALMAEAYEKGRQMDKGLTWLAEALEAILTTGDRSWEADLYRRKGELLLALSTENQTDAEAYFHQALAIAHRQQAKSWELRAATSLARLWQSQDKRQEAYDLLAPVYDWFTEGFDTADLIDAKGLLEALAPSSQDG